jgi:hypothetical protein
MGVTCLSIPLGIMLLLAIAFAVFRRLPGTSRELGREEAVVSCPYCGRLVTTMVRTEHLPKTLKVKCCHCGEVFRIDADMFRVIVTRQK